MNVNFTSFLNYNFYNFLKEKKEEIRALLPSDLKFVIDLDSILESFEEWVKFVYSGMYKSNKQIAKFLEFVYKIYEKNKENQFEDIDLLKDDKIKNAKDVWEYLKYVGSKEKKLVNPNSSNVRFRKMYQILLDDPNPLYLVVHHIVNLGKRLPQEVEKEKLKQLEKNGYSQVVKLYVATFGEEREKYKRYFEAQKKLNTFRQTWGYNFVEFDKAFSELEKIYKLVKSTPIKDFPNLFKNEFFVRSLAVYLDQDTYLIDNPKQFDTIKKTINLIKNIVLEKIKKSSELPLESVKEMKNKIEEYALDVILGGDMSIEDIKFDNSDNKQEETQKTAMLQLKIESSEKFLNKLFSQPDLVTYEEFKKHLDSLESIPTLKNFVVFKIEKKASEQPENNIKNYLEVYKLEKTGGFLDWYYSKEKPEYLIDEGEFERRVYKGAPKDFYRNRFQLTPEEIYELERQIIRDNLGEDKKDKLNILIKTIKQVAKKFWSKRPNLAKEIADLIISKIKESYKIFSDFKFKKDEKQIIRKIQQLYREGLGLELLKILKEHPDFKNEVNSELSEIFVESKINIKESVVDEELLKNVQDLVAEHLKLSIPGYDLKDFWDVMIILFVLSSTDDFLKFFKEVASSYLTAIENIVQIPEFKKDVDIIVEKKHLGVKVVNFILYNKPLNLHNKSFEFLVALEVITKAIEKELNNRKFFQEIKNKLEELKQEIQKYKNRVKERLLAPFKEQINYVVKLSEFEKYEENLVKKIEEELDLSTIKKITDYIYHNQHKIFSVAYQEMVEAIARKIFSYFLPEKVSGYEPKFENRYQFWTILERILEILSSDEDFLRKIELPVLRQLLLEIKRNKDRLEKNMTITEIETIEKDVFLLDVTDIVKFVKRLIVSEQ